MKKLISTILALTVVASAVTATAISASAFEAKKDQGMLYSAEDQIGNGYNDHWGGGGGLVSAEWENGTKQFTEGNTSISLLNSFDNKLSFFHNFIWDQGDGSYYKGDWHSGLGVDLTQFDYIEFDLASEYDIDCDMALCMCGQVGSWHGFDAARNNVHFDKWTWYHVVMPISEFIYQVCPSNGDPEAYVANDTGLSNCQRFRFEITGAVDLETGDVPDELLLYFDNMYGTTGDAPKAAETLVWGDTFQYESDGTTLSKYRDDGKTSVITIPAQTTAIAANVFADAKTLKRVTVPTTVTSIADGNFEKIDGISIAGYPDSYAQTYATEKGLTFIDLSNMPGDVNGDGTVGSNDALMVLQSNVGKLKLDEKQSARADVNGDNEIDSKDALAILQYCVGKITSF